MSGEQLADVGAAQPSSAAPSPPPCPCPCAAGAARAVWDIRAPTPMMVAAFSEQVLDSACTLTPDETALCERRVAEGAAAAGVGGASRGGCRLGPPYCLSPPCLMPSSPTHAPLLPHTPQTVTTTPCATRHGPAPCAWAPPARAAWSRAPLRSERCGGRAWLTKAPRGLRGSTCLCQPPPNRHRRSLLRPSCAGLGW